MDFEKLKGKESKNLIDLTGLTSEMRMRVGMLMDFLSAPKNSRKSYRPDYEGSRYLPHPIPTTNASGNIIRNILLDNYLFEQMNSPPGEGGIYDQIDEPLPTKRKRKK